MNKREIGQLEELRSIRYLEENGITIIDKNYRERIGEIDIIGLGDGNYLSPKGYLIFFEVKYRSNDKAGLAEAAVGVKKQKIICRVSDYYRMKHKIAADRPIRFDVLACGNEIVWHKNAFDYIPAKR